MPSLTIRNLPDDLLERLRNAAAERRRSINAQALEWLSRASRQEHSAADCDRVLREVGQTRARLRPRRGDSTRLIRAMRDRR